MYVLRSIPWVALTLSGCGTMPGSSTPAPGAAPAASPGSKPCEVVITAADPATVECFVLDAVRVDGLPLQICSDMPTLRFDYDAQGRVVEARLDQPAAAPGATPGEAPAAPPRVTYSYDGAKVTRTTTSGETVEQVVRELDAAGRVVRDGEVRFTYDAAGRVARVDDGDDHVAFTYAADGTYTTSHTYPDTDEFCLADLVEVGRDAAGRVVRERYDNCGINEVPHARAYRYGADGALEAVDFDYQSDGSTDLTVTLRTRCGG